MKKNQDYSKTRIYYETNKEIKYYDINIKLKKKITCMCESIITKKSKLKHKKQINT